MNLDPLLFRLGDLPGSRRHILGQPAVEDLDLFASQPESTPRGIDGHVPAADNGHLLPDFNCFSQIDLP